MTDVPVRLPPDRRTFIRTGAAALGALPLLGWPRPVTAPRGDRMAWWREARFGMFIHWGLYSVLGGEWGGRTDYAEWIRNNAHIPLAEYDRLVGRNT